MLGCLKRASRDNFVMRFAMTDYRRICTVIAQLLVVFSLTVAAQGQVIFSSQTYPLTQTPFQVVTGDFNGDGKPDVAVLSTIGGTISILLANADGTFSPARDFPAISPQNFSSFSGSSFQGIAVGDVNGDGKLDLVTADPANPAGPSLNVLLGNGDGTFEPATVTELDFLVQVDFFIGVADFNGDKKSDVVVIGYDGTSMVGPFVLLGNGDGTFSRGVVMPVGFAPSGFVVADVNGDGKPDLVFCTGSVLDVFLGNGDGTFQSAISEPGPEGALVAGDFNHDGKLDLVETSFQTVGECEFGVCHYGPPGAFQVLLGVGDGTFGVPDVLASGNYGASALGDFDGDGNLDIAVFGFAPPNPKLFPAPSAIMLGDGRGGFPGQVGISFGEPVRVASADFNGDGLSDLALLNPGLEIVLNTTPGFRLTASASGPPVSPGGSATYTIDVGQQNGFSSAVTLACSAVASAGIGCSFSPSSVTPGNSATLTVTTMAASSALIWPSTLSQSKLLYALWLPMGAFLFGGIGSAERRYGRKKLAVLVLRCFVGFSLILQLGCASGSSSSKSMGTPAGSYIITITGTSGSLQRSTKVTLTVD
jgi:hypothetical protein